MKLWADTEFIDTGSELILLSLGVVREDGAEFYAEPAEADLTSASDWVRENVLPYLRGIRGSWWRGRDTSAWPMLNIPTLHRSSIAGDLRGFAGDSPEWWTGWGAYDWVLISQLYGPLVNRPRSWPMQPRPLEFVADRLGVDDDTDVPSEPECCPIDSPLRHLPSDAHHALAGAWWTKRLYEVCKERARPRHLLDFLGLAS